MKDLLRRWFLDNAALKLVALLLSVTLFIVVHGDKDTVISFDLGVGYTEAGDRVLVSQPVDSVRVTVKGPWTRVKRFDEREIEALRVDLAKLSDGEYVLSEDMIKLPPGLRVVAMNPPSIRLQFEERITKVIPVHAVVEGEPAHGYRVEHVETQPPYVMVRGPKSVVDALLEVRTRPLSVAGKSVSLEQPIGLAVDDSRLAIVDQPTVVLKVIIGEDQGQLALPEVAVSVRASPGTAAPAAAVGGFHVEPTSVGLILRGPRNLLDRVDVRAVTAHVTLHGEDLLKPSARPARVIVEGVPAGVAIEVNPRDVSLIPGSAPR